MAQGGRRQPPELPEQPYRSLGYYDRADRALFTGRDADIVRFAATLDRSGYADPDPARRERPGQVLVPAGRRDPLPGRAVRRLPLPPPGRRCRS